MRIGEQLGDSPVVQFALNCGPTWAKRCAKIGLIRPRWAHPSQIDLTPRRALESKPSRFTLRTQTLPCKPARGASAESKWKTKCAATHCNHSLQVALHFLSAPVSRKCLAVKCCGTGPASRFRSSHIFSSPVTKNSFTAAELCLRFSQLDIQEGVAKSTAFGTFKIRTRAKHAIQCSDLRRLQILRKCQESRMFWTLS